MRRRDFCSVTAAWAILSGPASAADGRATDESWPDASRRRDLPVRIRWPAGEGTCPLAIFSHGLGGNLDGGTLWGQAWQDAGIAVLHLQHPGSDSSIWRAGRRGVREAASAEQYLARVADAKFVLDEVERRARAGGLWARVRLDAIGFSGHSFGARLTQALAGERPRHGDSGADRIRDDRPRAFIAFSPGFSARDGIDDAEVARRFGAIDRPLLCVTGSKDDAMIVGDADHATRRAVYRGVPAGRKAELVLDGADHATFGGQAGIARGPIAARLLRRDDGAVAQEPRHQAIVAAVTADWWRWRLLGDAAAAERLRAPAGLGPSDLWQQG
jgi:hypothetical protein